MENLHPARLNNTHESGFEVRRENAGKACALFSRFLIALLLPITQSYAVIENGNSPNVREHAAFNLVLNDLETGQQLSHRIEVETEIDIQVTGPIVRATVRQRFNNPSQSWAEGIYSYPLPENATVDHMRLKIGDRIVESQIQEKKQALRAYQKAKAQGKQSALLEKPKGNIFTTRIANIAPQDGLMVEFTYQEFLDYRNNGYSLRVPLVVTPQYTPAESRAAHPAPFRFKQGYEPPGNPVEIRVNVEAGHELAHINSSSHTAYVERQSASSYVVNLPGSAAQSNRDFVLDWSFKPRQTPAASVFYETFLGESFGLLRLLPPSIDSAIEPLARELIIVLDVSGSMSGPSIRQAKAAVRSTIEQLKPEDSFNVVFFNSRTWSLFPASRAANRNNKMMALAGLTQIDADGGTEMHQALSLAMSYPLIPTSLTQLVLITDGAVSNERQLFQLIKNRLESRRLFTVGIGSAPNGFLMRRAAEAGRGSYSYVADVASVDEAIRSLMETLRRPALTDIALDFNRPVELVTTKVPDLYAQQARYIAFKSSTRPSRLTVRGQFNGEEQTLPLQLHAKDSGGVNKEWARQGIERLVQQLSIADTSQREEIRQRVTELGLKHQQVSKFTSLVAVDPRPVRAGGALKSEKIRSNLPMGWQAGQENSIVLAQTATGAPWMTQAGLFWLVVALILLALVAVTDCLSGTKSGTKPALNREP